jgi:hypothetical protein
MAGSQRLLLILLVIAGLSFSVNVSSPVEMDVQEGDIIDLGTIGPGQTIDIKIDPVVTEGGLRGQGGYYDMAIASRLPDDWTSEKSKLYGRPLQVTITAPPDAPEGDYSAKITVIDEMNGEKLGNITFTAWIHVTWDVLDVDIEPERQKVGPEQPARYSITVWNKGAASDVFQITATGSKRFELNKSVFVPPNSARTINYVISGKEEETYESDIRVVSLASKNIHKEGKISLTIEPNLLSDYKATNHGVMVFPIFEALIHGFAGLLSNFY